MSKKEERWKNPKPKTRNPNPNTREENGKKGDRAEKKKEGTSASLLSSVKTHEFSVRASSGLQRFDSSDIT